eukprot:m.69519 g.69519  ORF g.69519 m.69519 type:complete len:908 (-) comp8589_c0_seq1:73-2796(-)
MVRLLRTGGGFDVRFRGRVAQWSFVLLTGATLSAAALGLLWTRSHQPRTSSEKTGISHRSHINHSWFDLWGTGGDATDTERHREPTATAARGQPAPTPRRMAATASTHDSTKDRGSKAPVADPPEASETRVVAYCLYGGDNARYTDGALENAQLMLDVYPGWQMWVYHDATAPRRILDTLKEYNHVRLIDMSKDAIRNKMSWKFLAASDKRVDRYIFRDVDSRLSMRERWAVEEWIASGRAFHVMRDHPSHSSYAMSGGMWGGTRRGIPHMESLIRGSHIKTAYVEDMNFLNKHVWPIVKRDVLQHDAFSCTRYGGGRPFPRPRQGGEHVGGVVLNGQLRQGDVDILLGTPQPPECRERGAASSQSTSAGTSTPPTAPTVPPPPTAPVAWVRIAKGAAGSNAGCGDQPCIFDPTYCQELPTAAGQCAMLESEARDKCGRWDVCAGVVCRDDYLGFCLARGRMDPAKASENMWGYRKLRGGGEITAATDRGATAGEGVPLSSEGRPMMPVATTTTAAAINHAATAAAADAAAAAVAERPLTVWSNDFHISTIGTVKSLLQPRGVVFIDKSLSGACGTTHTCAKDLRVLNSRNGISPPDAVVRKFVASYSDDKELAGADVVMCFHPAAMCELFLPLRKHVFVIATTRYEMGRESVEAWTRWNQNLVKIASDPINLVAANSRYDAAYIRYFTGLSPMVLPSVVRMDSTYHGANAQDILLATSHSPNHKVLTQRAMDALPAVVPLKTKFPDRYTYGELCKSRAILHLPYQVSTMSFFEQYAMGIPLLVPTPEFLWELHDELDVVTERTWHRVRHGQRPSKSIMGPAPGYEKVPDPNNDVNREAFLHWVRMGDWYTWPHIITFGSWDELGSKVATTNWTQVSMQMLKYNEMLHTRVQRQMLGLLQDVRRSHQ